MFGRPNAPVTLLKVRSQLKSQLAVAIQGRSSNQNIRFRMDGMANHGMMNKCDGKNGMMNECDGKDDSDLGPCSVGRTRR